MNPIDINQHKIQNPNPFFSVIIPVYNAEAFLEKCLDSILEQSFKSFELICINDGSTDNSLKILEFYSNKDHRLKIISKENQGPASARNLGLSLAKGEYLWLIDADDWVSECSFEILKNALELDKPDILGFSAYTYDNQTKKLNLDHKRDLKYLPTEHLNNLQNYKLTKNYLFDLPVEVWCRVYKREFILNKSIKFEEKVWGIDDGVFVAETYLKAQKFKHISDVLYTYRVSNPKSVVFMLKGVQRKTYKSSIIFAQKCDEIIENTKASLDDVELLIDRNLFRMIYYYKRANPYYKYKVFNEIKEYLKKSKTLSYEFIKNNERYSVFYKIQAYSFLKFITLQFIYSKNYKLCKHYKSIYILGLPVYRKTK